MPLGLVERVREYASSVDSKIMSLVVGAAAVYGAGCASDGYPPGQSGQMPATQDPQYVTGIALQTLPSFFNVQTPRQMQAAAGLQGIGQALQAHSIASLQGGRGQNVQGSVQGEGHVQAPQAPFDPYARNRELAARGEYFALPGYVIVDHTIPSERRIEIFKEYMRKVLDSGIAMDQGKLSFIDDLRWKDKVAILNEYAIARAAVLMERGLDEKKLKALMKKRR